ncbi:acyltransferase [Arcicella rosea]|uniref:Peptidoglycan/LPS O-acetylase OafA/YrhL n=1 Tax=Arcicella rosea TaxID=502909 RepID=A0A841ENL1_9BACT|nr:acyltransferase [Arcicella rosea]MBB6004496.1 peptidoglycan/LPS O-acetylase OafA/YrhL [Arcicella rosea]
MSSKKVINSIQFLRGFAAFVVVFYHIGGYIKKNFPVDFLGDFFGFGFAGVDLFFVISGFIIHFTSKQYFGNPSKLKEYLIKRIVRVFPIYWIILTVMFFFSWLTSIISHREVFGANYPHNLVSYFQTYLLLPLHPAINAVSWTLSYELFFYFIFSFLIISKRLWFVPVCILMVSAFNLILIEQSGSKYFKFIFSGYNIEFMLGFLICKFYDKLKLSSILSLIILILALGIILIWGNEVSDFDYIKRILVFGLSSGLILISLLNLESNRTVKVPQFSILVGNASYVLYLIHFPMLLLLNKIPLLLGFKLSMDGVIFYNYFIVLVILCSSLTIHRFIEKPISLFLSDKLKSK